jgi:hypothetical protein
MPEVRFKIDDSLYSKASELQQLGHFDTVGSAVRSLMGIFLEPSIEAIKRNQQAVANGAMFSPAVVPTAPALPPATSSAPAIGGFGDSLSSLLKS